VLAQSRERIADSIFKVFSSSVDNASVKKQNSLVIFMSNLKEYRSQAEPLMAAI
jgi:hypothetical protein